MISVPNPMTVRESADKLHRQVWKFWINERLEIVLDEYREEHRDSLRQRNWKTGRLYRRTSGGNERSNMPVEDVPFDQDIQDDARRQVIACLTVKKTWTYGGGR